MKISNIIALLAFAFAGLALAAPQQDKFVAADEITYVAGMTGVT
jgi:hypothetical protein